MILLDTNILSELTRPLPHAGVLKWLDALDPHDTWICAITVAEIKLGVALLPEGKRRDHLAALADDTIQRFAGLCMAFDSLAAEEFASIVARRRRVGRPITYSDAQIAAIARSNGLTLATRNADDFRDIENLKVIDPWAAG